MCYTGYFFVVFFFGATCTLNCLPLTFLLLLKRIHLTYTLILTSTMQCVWQLDSWYEASHPAGYG